MARVALVTPADANSPTVQAFIEEGDGFKWNKGDVVVYSGADPQWKKDISIAAGAAVGNLDAGGVLVAAGEMAATILQEMTTQYPIIMAFGGREPSNTDKKAQNMIGFVGDCTTVARKHLSLLKGNFKKGSDITVLYDKDGDSISGAAAKNDVTQHILGKLKGDDNSINAQPIDTANIQGQIDALLTTPGFMIVPNAVFFEQAAAITKAVDNSNNVQIAYYPEFYFYTQYNTKKKAKIVGFNVPATYRVAANWVNYILLGLWTTTQIISAMNNKQFAQAIEDPYLTPDHPSSLLKDRRHQPKRSPERKASTKQSMKRKKGPKQPTQRKRQKRRARQK
jgi:hypothetical protein